MKLRHLHFECLVVLASLVLLLALSACTSQARVQPKDLQTLSVGMDGSAVSGLIYIAVHQGYFTENDLAVNIKTYPSGLAAMDGMLKHEVDMAVASEFALVGKVFAGEPVRSLASIDRFMHNYLMARTSSGIQTVADLRGKKIGVPLKTAAEFYLGRYLDLNGLSLQEVTAINIPPTDLPAALQRGEVDAVVVWPPYTRTIEDQLGSAVFRWSVQNDQVGFVNLVSQESWVRQNPERIERFLRALVQAEAFYAGNPQAVREILKKNLTSDDAYLTSILAEHQFQVALDQSMILAMEDEARWMINNQIVTHRQTPNFLDTLYLDGLLAVRPDSVNIIR